MIRQTIYPIRDELVRQTIRCPAHRDPKGGDLVGCGGTNVQGPDYEGLYDCLDCGIWFTREDAMGRLPLQEQKP